MNKTRVVGKLMMALVFSCLVAVPVGAATLWIAPLNAATTFQGQSTSVSPPSGVSGTCNGKTVIVSWTAPAHSTSYSVYKSTTTISGTYTSIASGVTATTFTTANLGNSQNWFKVSTLLGSNWKSAQSVPTARFTITGATCASP
jgi:hypothetical protein